IYQSDELVFFYSSRRRHTIFSRDWSSDVCSSDLEIDCRKTRIWFEENYKNDIKESIFNKIHQNRKAPEIDDVFYFIDEDLIVNFDTNCSIVRFLFKKTDICKVEKIADNIRKFKKRKKTKSEIFLLINSRFGIDTEPMKITKQKLNITENYNDDFLPIHKII